MTDLSENDPAERPDVPALGHLVAVLSGDRADVTSLTNVLTGALADALPAGVVAVDYERSLSDRMKGREGRPKGIAVSLGDTVLSMTVDAAGRPQPIVAHSVRGVVLTRRPVTVAEWVSLLAEQVRELAAQDEQARVVLSRLLLG